MLFSKIKLIVSLSKRLLYVLYLYGVNGSLMWHKRGQEALVAKFSNVAGYVSSVDKDL